MEFVGLPRKPAPPALKGVALTKDDSVVAIQNEKGDALAIFHKDDSWIVDVMEGLHIGVNRFTLVFAGDLSEFAEKLYNATRRIS